MNSRTEQNPGLGSSGDKEKPATNEPTMQEIGGLNRKNLLEWLKQKLSLEPKDEGKFSEKFSEAEIDAQLFLKNAGNLEFFQNAGLSYGLSFKLANLASEVMGKKTIGTKSKSYLSCHARHADVHCPRWLRHTATPDICTLHFHFYRS